MSGAVDDEVVRMRFDNNAFERGVATTLSTLTKLKSSLNFTGSDKGLSNIENKANRMSFQGMTNGIEGVSKKFLAMSTIAITALANIANRAVNAGLSMAKSLTIAPIMDGFHEYETQLNSVQTILANTGLKGSSGMSQVNSALNELNTYSDKTIYNFSEMARNIGTFTAAGVKLKPATAAIKGIANVAALSGSSSEQASTAMYQLSQAIANNKVGLQDWNSVVNAGMGGKVFQQALFNTAKLKGTLKGVDANTTFDQWTKSGNSFRDSLKSGWITGDVLTQTLSQFTGDLTDAQLKSMGYNAQQIKSIQEQARTAADAATKVKTFTQLMGTLKEAVGSGWAQSFGIIFGNFDEAKTLWTGVSNSIGGLISNSAKARNKVLGDWKALGGRKALIAGIQNAFTALGSVIKPIKDAFRDIFPAKTGAELASLTRRFQNFMANLKIGGTTAENLKRTFRGVFAVFDILKQVVGGVFHAFGMLFGAIGKGSGGFLNFTGNIGDMIVAFDEALKKGDFFRNLFTIIGNVIQIPIHMIGILTTAISGIFSGFKPKDASGMTDSVTSAGNALGRVAQLTQNVSDWFGSLSGKIKPGIDAVVNGLKRIGEAIANGLNSQAFGNILKSLQTGLLAGIVILLKKFFSKGLNVDIGGGFLGTAKEALEGVTGSLKAMQLQLKAKALLEIAGAIGIITLSVVALSMVNASKLSTALKAMAVGFGELLGAMAILTKISGSAGFVKLPLIAASLDMLAVAILLLTAAVAAMAQLSWQEIEKGLTAVGALLAGLSVASMVLSANSAGMIRSGIGILAIAVALNLLFVAVKGFSTLSWKEMWKGLAGVGTALGGIALAMRLMPKGMTLQAAAILLIATALNALYLAVREFSSFSWKDMVKGLVGVAGGLVAIAIGMKLMPPGMVLQAAALNLIALALLTIGKAVKNMSKMSWSAIGKGLAGLAGALLILAGAMYLMEGALPGAAALLVVAGALRIFVPALMALSTMSWGDLLKGLVGLAASFAVIGVAGLLLTPVIPSLLALGVALGLVGVAMMAFGAGAALLGIGLTAIAASGGAAIGVLIGGLKSLFEMLPMMATNLAKALVGFITVIGANAPKIVGAFVSILNQLLQAVPKIMPNLIVAIGSIITAILKVLVDNAPKVIAAGFKLLMDLLKGIRDNIGNIVGVVADIIIKFLNALAAKMPGIVNAGVNLLFKFLEGVARAAGRIPGEVLKLIGIFLSSLFGNFGKIFSGGAKLLGKLVGGILGGIGKMASAAASLVGRMISALGGLAGRIISAGVRMLGSLIKGIMSAVGSAASSLASAGWKLAKHLVDGLVNGIKDMAGNAMDAVTGLAGDMVSSVADFLGIGGPSQVFHDIGEKGIGGGLINGLNAVSNKVAGSVRNLSADGVLAMKKTITGLSDAIANTDVDYNPTITPVLDLSQIQKAAPEIGNIVGANPVKANVSYAQAKDISARQLAEAAASASPEQAASDLLGATIKFEQNNYSPKALSTVDVYRQSKNLISMQKQALGIPIRQVVVQE